MSQTTAKKATLRPDRAQVAMNLGAIDLTKTTIKIVGAEVMLTNLLLLRLFFTFAAFGGAVGLYYFRAIENRYDKVVEYLAKKEKYNEALVMTKFDAWFAKSTDEKFLRRLAMTLSLMTFCLLAVLPIGTFIYCVIRS